MPQRVAKRSGFAAFTEIVGEPGRLAAPTARFVSAKKRMRGDFWHAQPSVHACPALAGSGWQDVRRLLMIRVNLCGPGSMFPEEVAG